MKRSTWSAFFFLHCQDHQDRQQRFATWEKITRQSRKFRRMQVIAGPLPENIALINKALQIGTKHAYPETLTQRSKIRRR